MLIFFIAFAIVTILLLALTQEFGRRRVFRWRPTLERLTDRVVPAYIVWDGGGGANNNWSLAANWSDPDGNNVVPGPQDHAILDNTANTNSIVDAAFGGTIAGLTITETYTSTITLNRTLTLKAVAGEVSRQAAGRITGQASLIIEPGTEFNWTGGTMGSAGQFGSVWLKGHAVTPAIMNISGEALKTLDTWYLQNEGVVTWTGEGHIKLMNGAEIWNLAFSFFLVENDVGFENMEIESDASATLFTVDPGATFESQVGLQSRVIMNAEFVNDGTVNILNEELALTRGSISSGEYDIAGGARLELAGLAANAHIFRDGTNVNGGGAVWLLAKLIVQGTVNVNSFSQFQGTTLDGPGTLKVNGTFTWTGGDWKGTGTTWIMPNKAINIEGPLEGAAVNVTMDQRSLKNEGIATWRGRIDITLKNQAKIDNETGATFDVKTDQKILDGGAAGNFTNKGILKKTGSDIVGPGVCTFNVLLDNVGGHKPIEQSGSFKFAKGVKNRQMGLIEIGPNGMQVVGNYDQDGGTTTVTFGTLTVTNGDYSQSSGSSTAMGNTSII